MTEDMEEARDVGAGAEGGASATGDPAVDAEAWPPTAWAWSRCARRWTRGC